MLAELEAIDDHPAQDHDLKLDERKAWKFDLLESRKFWTGKPEFFEFDYEGFRYDCAIWTMERRDGETYFEFRYYAEDEDGHIRATACPLSRRGHTFEMRYGKVKPEDARATTEEILIAWIEKMKPIRILQDGDIITPQDIRKELARLLQTPVYKGQTWQEYIDRGGITDEELKAVVKSKFGSSGSSGPESISVNREGVGFRLWMSWTKWHYNTKPIIQGQATIDLAREILRTDHGVFNPDDKQQSLF